MSQKTILHMLTPHKHVSPFDVNMAADAGFDVIVPYDAVTLGEVSGLVQDAIFSRPPKWGTSTGIFIGGNDAVLALDMVDAARKALVPPFGVPIFADPSGSFTTGAAMVALVERQLRATGRTLQDTPIAIFGATGVVAYCAAVIAALEGARVTLVGHDGPERVGRRAAEMQARFDVSVEAADGATPAGTARVLADTQVVLSAARAGLRVLTREALAAAPSLLVAADVNAVPPSGIEGVDAGADGVPIDGMKAVGVGALAIGNVKYRTQAGLFRRMLSSDTPLVLDFRDAFAFARGLVA